MKLFIILSVALWLTKARPVYPSFVQKATASSIEKPPEIFRDQLKFDYPQEISQISAINRVEIPAKDKKTFQFQISELNTNCTISLSYYVSVIKNGAQTNNTKARLRVYDPSGQLIGSGSSRLGSKKEPFLNLSLGHIGKYKFVFANNNSVDLVVDIVFGLTNCHTIPHKMHSRDLIQLKNRFEAYQMKQTVV